MLDAVLLEWDGVLADTGGARRDALLRALADEGVPVTGAAYDECWHALDLPDAVASLTAGLHDDPTLVELVMLRARRAFTEILGRGVTLVPGAADLVAAAPYRVRLAIVSRASRMETDAFLTTSGLRDSFAVVIASDDSPPAASGRTRFDDAITHLSRLRPTPPERVAALVATASAIRDARTAGIRTLAVGAPAHVALEADAVVDTLVGLGVHDIARLVGADQAARSA